MHLQLALCLEDVKDVLLLNDTLLVGGEPTVEDSAEGEQFARRGCARASPQQVWDASVRRTWAWAWAWARMRHV